MSEWITTVTTSLVREMWKMLTVCWTGVKEVPEPGAGALMAYPAALEEGTALVSI